VEPPAAGEAAACCRLLRACRIARPTPPPDAAFWGPPTSPRAAQHRRRGPCAAAALLWQQVRWLAVRCFHGPRCTTPRRRRPPLPRCGSGGGRCKAGTVTIPSSALAYLLRRLDWHVLTRRNVQSAYSSSRRSQVHAQLVESTESTRRNTRVESTHTTVDWTHRQSSRRT
jgi:hypothetical protein